MFFRKVIVFILTINENMILIFNTQTHVLDDINQVLLQTEMEEGFESWRSVHARTSSPRVTGIDQEASWDMAGSQCYSAGTSESLKGRPCRQISDAHSGVFVYIVFVLTIHTVAWSPRWRSLMVFPDEQMAWKGMKWNSETFILAFYIPAYSLSSSAYGTLCYLLTAHTLGNLLLLTGDTRIQEQIVVFITVIFDFSVLVMI